MPDQPLYQEFGKPMAESGTTTSDEIFDKKYGKYKDLVLEPQGGTAPDKFNEQPFTIKGQ